MTDARPSPSLPRCIAVVLAGGSGTRFGAPLPKQFLEVGGCTLLERSVRAFQASPLISEIYVVVHPDHLERARALLLKDGCSKVTHILPGGSERHHSSLAAIRACADDDACLLFHDAVRPLLTPALIATCVEALRTHRAVNVALPATDTVMEVDATGRIIAIPPRANLRNSQTPQCFRRGDIRRAYEAALRDPAFTATDDCGVVLRYLPEVPIHCVTGERTNFKVTFPEDVARMELELGLTPHNPLKTSK